MIPKSYYKIELEHINSLEISDDFANAKFELNLDLDYVSKILLFSTVNNKTDKDYLTNEKLVIKGKKIYPYVEHINGFHDRIFYKKE